MIVQWHLNYYLDVTVSRIRGTDAKVIEYEINTKLHDISLYFFNLWTHKTILYDFQMKE